VKTGMLSSVPNSSKLAWENLKKSLARSGFERQTLMIKRK
jgi:hypothetical protein